MRRETIKNNNNWPDDRVFFGHLSKWMQYVLKLHICHLIDGFSHHAMNQMILRLMIRFLIRYLSFKCLCVFCVNFLIYQLSGLQILPPNKYREFNYCLRHIYYVHVNFFAFIIWLQMFDHS